jgi:hypothetical protein
MHQSDQLPWPIGQTAGVTGSTDMIQWEGREFLVEDLDYSANPAKARAYSDSVEWKRIRVVRNVSGVSLLPAMLVSFKSTAHGKQVDGYADVYQEECYPTDEFLPSTGVANNDLFYIVVDGPAGIKVSVTAAESVIATGSWVHNVTAAASTHSTTAGRIQAATFTGSTAVLANTILYRIGIMMSSSTTADTGAVRLVRVKKW